MRCCVDRPGQHLVGDDTDNPAPPRESLEVRNWRRRRGTVAHPRLAAGGPPCVRLAGLRVRAGFTAALLSSVAAPSSLQREALRSGVPFPAGTSSSSGATQGLPLLSRWDGATRTQGLLRPNASELRPCAWAWKANGAPLLRARRRSAERRSTSLDASLAAPRQGAAFASSHELPLRGEFARLPLPTSSSGALSTTIGPRRDCA